MLRGPPSFLFTGYWGSFLGIKGTDSVLFSWTSTFRTGEEFHNLSSRGLSSIALNGCLCRRGARIVKRCKQHGETECHRRTRGDVHCTSQTDRTAAHGKSSSCIYGSYNQLPRAVQIWLDSITEMNIRSNFLRGDSVYDARIRELRV